MEGIEGSFVGVLVDEDVQLLDGNAEIGLVELVSVHPAEWSEKSSLLDDSMEEEKSEQKLLELEGHLVAVEELRQADRSD